MAFDLNPSQRAAVAHNDGPMLVLAGAGSGKTRVVTLRIARLIEQGTPAWSILALTFTNKAAQEMRERAAQLTDAKSAKELRVTTFHSFGLDFLRKECRALGFRGDSFSIYDQSDCQAQLRELLRGIDAGRKFDISAILARISIAKNAFETEENWNTRPGDEYDEIARVVFPKYVATLRSLQALDFDDLVTETVSVLSKREDIRQKWVSKIRYMMVDEYQDTNASQLELVRLLAGDHHNVMVVGDDDQAIYGWRGADVNNILDFEHHFKGTKVVKLEENYRSVGAVLHVANAVLAASRAKRLGKVLKPTREEGPKVELVVCPDPEVEASAIADEIQRSKANDPSLKWRDIAVLYRSNAQGQPIEIALRELAIPYRLLGGQKFYERKEVKDLLAYLRVSLQPEEELSLRRVVNYPARGIGEVALKKLSAFATIQETTLWNAVRNAEAIDDLPPNAIEACSQFVNIVQSTRAVIESTKNLEAAALHIIQAIALKDDLLAASSGEQFARRWGNVEAMLNMLRRRDSKGPNEISALQEYIRFLSLNIDSSDEEAQDVVTLQTMHGSKGLEYRLVLVAGLEEGIMPHTRSLNPKATDMMPQDVEEERRLFYVCVTRARDRLILHRTKLRGTPEKPIPRVPSRFLLDVPAELINEREVTQKVAPTTESLAKGAEGLLAALGVMGSPGASGPATRPSHAARPGPTRPYSAASSGAPPAAAPSAPRPFVERPSPRPPPRPAAPKQPIPKTGWWSR